MSGSSDSLIGDTVRIPMRDGIRLSVHIHRPARAAPVPALLNFTPYRKGALGKAPPIVSHGYASLVVDVRGTGNSEGLTDSVYSAAERQDGYDMVEWAAAQPWCNGRVGVWGISYGAVAALQIAAAAPPHLQAIIARSGSDDPFAEWTCPDGTPRPYIFSCYAPLMAALNFAPPDPAEVGDRWRPLWEQRLRENVPWGLSFTQHIADGPFWRERAIRGHYDRIQCAVFVVDGWADWYCTPLLRIFAGLKGPKRALIGPWSHEWPDTALPGPRINWTLEAVRWFDYWLKQIDTGVMRDPPLTLFVREYSPPQPLILQDQGRFRGESDWPIARRRETTLFFGPQGGLSPHAPTTAEATGGDTLTYDQRVGGWGGMHGGGPFNTNWVMPLDQRPDEALSLTYTSAPLTEDWEIIGQPQALVHVSTTGPTTLVAVKLSDVAPDGASALITKGYLNAAWREPVAGPQPLDPGRVYALTIALLACAYRLTVGHCLRVTIAAADCLNRWPTPVACRNTVFRDASHPSHIRLPLVPMVSDTPPPPHLHRLAPVEAHERPPPPEFSVTHDLIQGATTVAHRAVYDVALEQSGQYRVSSADPACATARTQTRYRCRCGDRTIVLEARCETASDHRQFQHQTDLEITTDGHPFFQRQWSASAPRDFF